MSEAKDPLEDFKPKYIQGLYSYLHYEREDGAWFQVSIDTRRLEVTFMPYEGGKFRKYANLDELRKALTK